jgi:hypothetical protein
MTMSYILYVGEQYSPRNVFERKKANCADWARLHQYFLLENGYKKYASGNTGNNSCCVLSVKSDKLLPDGGDGHAVCLYTGENGYIKYIDTRGGIKGPFEVVKDAAMNVAREKNFNMSYYIIK